MVVMVVVVYCCSDVGGVEETAGLYEESRSD